MKLIFIAWDGTGVHYMQGLFLPIMVGLQKKGFEVEIIHLSSIQENLVFELEQLAVKEDVVYRHIAIERSGVGFLKAIIKGTKALRTIKRTKDKSILMPRSLMPALLVWLSGIGANTMIYDADGLALEERIDFAGWKRSSVKFRLFKFIEQWALRNSRFVLVRTIKAKEILCKQYPFLLGENVFKVINGKETEFFKPQTEVTRANMRKEMGLSDLDILVVYCGTIAPQYCLTEMLKWFEYLLNHRPSAKFLLLTGQMKLVQQHAAFNRLKGRLILKTVSASQVPDYLGLADVSLAFRRSTFSMMGVAPIKIGEYLLCGLPVIASRKIGDTEEELDELNFSQVLNHESEEELFSSVRKFISQNKEVRYPIEESVDLGIRKYSMTAAQESYKNALANAT